MKDDKEWDKALAKTQELISKAKTQVILSSPFYASILLRRPVYYTDQVPLFGVDPWATIYINPMTVQKLSVPNIIFGLCHECWHIMGSHKAREGTRDHRRWNVATDAYINDMLKDSHMGEVIQGGVDMPGSKDKTCEDIYDNLPEQESGPGGTGDDLFGGLDGNGNSKAPPTQQQQQEMATEVKIEIAQAVRAAEMRGNMPADLKRVVDELLEVYEPWEDHLREFMVGQVKQDYSWMRPNRKHFANGIYMPSMDKVPTMGKLVIQVDTSGSIGGRILDNFAAHMNLMIEQCNPEEVIVLYTDAEVAGVDRFTPEDYPVSVNARGGGGTDMHAGIRWVEEQHEDIDCFVCLTDGCTPWGTEPAFPVFWAITDKGITAPYGKSVFIKVV